MNPRVNVGRDCHLLGLLLSHSDKSSKKVEKRRFQVAQKEQEQKEQNLFKWSIPGKGTTQTRFSALLFKTLRNKSSAVKF